MRGTVVVWQMSWAAIALLACGPSTSSDTTGDGGNIPAASDGGSDAPISPLAHAIDGFDLAVKQGSWWEYSSVYDSSYVFDTGSGSTHSQSTFVLMLGAPITIAGDQAFPVQKMVLSSSCTANPGKCAADGPVGTWQAWTKWKYLSFAGKRIRGSADGQSYSVLFDAKTAVWPATNNGIFGDFPGNTGLRQATSVAGASGTVWLVQENSTTTGCDEIPGYGVVCNSSGNGSVGGSEKWDPALGCIASTSGGNGYSNTGSANNSSSTTLVDSSVAGDRSPPPPSSGSSGGGVSSDAGAEAGGSSSGGSSGNGDGGSGDGGTSGGAAASCGGTVTGCGNGPPKLICLGSTCGCSGSVASCSGAYECWCNGPTATTCSSQSDCCCSGGSVSCTPGGC
jgi:hypothetical protein